MSPSAATTRESNRLAERRRAWTEISSHGRRSAKSFHADMRARRRLPGDPAIPMRQVFPRRRVARGVVTFDKGDLMRGNSKPSSLASCILLFFAAACGGTPANQPSDAGLEAGGASNGAGGGGATSQGGVGGSGPGCPSTPPLGLLDNCNLAPGVKCQYSIQCQSGVQSFTYSCRGTDPALGWQLAAKACDPARPGDSCFGTDLYCDNGNWGGECAGCDPPYQSCPSAAPAPGSSCSLVSGDHARCGYPCNPEAGTGWHVATCAAPDGGGPETWQYDTSCP